MNWKPRSLVAAAGVLALAATLFAGCSKGSSSKGNASTTTSVTSSTLGITGSRDGAGYLWASTITANNDPNGAVTAIARVESVALAAIGSNAEVLEVAVASVQTATITQRGTGFTFQPTSLAVVGSRAYAGTTQALAGSGDIYQRQGSLWTRVVDGDQQSMVVAALDGAIYGLSGSPESNPVVHHLGVGSTTFAERSDLFPTQCVPTVAIPHFGSLYVGGAPATATGAACLFRGSFASGFQQVPLPAGAVDLGSRQRVTSLLSLPNGLVVGLGEFDVATGAARSGSIWLLAFNRFEQLHSLSQDAPLSLALQDGTIYAGTAAGSLLYLDPRGRFIQEPNVPINQGVTALLPQSTGVLLVGMKTVNGARIGVRIGNSNKPGGGGSTGGGGNTTYLTTIKPLLSASCVSCHSTLTTGYSLTTALGNDANDYAATIAHVDTGSAATSNFLRRASGELPHTGGALWPSGSGQYDSVLQWIRDGARFDANGTGGGGGGGGGGSTDPTYVADVKPILQANSCLGCHVGLTGSMPLSAGLADNDADFTSVRNEVDLTTPANSNFLRNATQQDAHPFKGFDVGSTEYNKLLEWIQTGAKKE